MQSYDTMKPKVKRKALCTFDFLQKVQLKYESKMRGQVARATENRLLSPSAQTGQGDEIAPANIEYRMANIECRSPLHYPAYTSTFDIRHSIFDI